jgi:DAACS family dicarboxylate/amino acid:cation (Na+ or H+) symporter
MYLLKIPIYAQTIFAMLLGIVAGIILGPKAASFGVLAKYIIEIIKTAATPLLFLAIFDAFVSIEIKGKGFLALLFVCILNACCAITIALAISHYFKPGSFLILDPALKAQAVIPQTFNLDLHWTEHLSKKNGGRLFTGTTAAILSALVCGLIFTFLKICFGNRFLKPQQLFQTYNQKLLKILYKIIGVLVHLTPIAVFSAMAKVIGVQGFSAIQGLGAYLLACAGGMFLQVVLVYQFWIKFIAKRSLKTFWKEIKEPFVYSFGINSSLATLPITLQALKRLKVSESSSRLAACIGTNLNNEV